MLKHNHKDASQNNFLSLLWLHAAYIGSGANATPAPLSNPIVAYDPSSFVSNIHTMDHQEITSPADPKAALDLSIPNLSPTSPCDL